MSKSNGSNCKVKAERGALLFSKAGIYAVDDDNKRKRIADPIMVTAFATSDPGTTREEAFTEIRFLDRRGKWKETIIPASMLTAQANEFIKLLSRLGYIWPKDKKLEIVSELSVVRPERNIRVTSVPGWHGKFFALPGESYGPNGSTRKKLRIIHNPTVKLGEFRRSGTLQQWKKFVAKKCIHSTRARLAVAATFAAPNLRMLGLSSFGFNFSGQNVGRQDAAAPLGRFDMRFEPRWGPCDLGRDGCRRSSSEPRVIGTASCRSTTSATLMATRKDGQVHYVSARRQSSEGKGWPIRGRAESRGSRYSCDRAEH